MTKLNALLYVFISVFISCSNNNIIKVKNEKQGQLKSTFELQETSEKKFVLDSVTAPKVRYSQIYTDSNGKRTFTFLNNNNNSIYFYDYETLKFVKSLPFKKGSTKSFKPAAYYIKTPDSIYIYNTGTLDLLLADRYGSFFKTISLIGNMKIRDIRWISKYPQYYPQTAIPFLITTKELLFPGQYMGTISESIIDTFKFMTHINLKTNKVNYTSTYPHSLYGFDYNWYGHFFTKVYADLHPDEDKLVYSFPISHDLYISNFKSNTYKTVYGGSNNAGTISSIDTKSSRVSNNVLESHFIKNDVYGAIKYDKYRKVYYRLLQSAIPDATEDMLMKEKPVVIIIMDEKFNYLGETTIGKLENWYVENTFVTQEGLNIEYIEKDFDETYLTLKIFNLKKIK